MRLALTGLLGGTLACTLSVAGVGCGDDDRGVGVGSTVSTNVTTTGTGAGSGTGGAGGTGAGTGGEPMIPNTPCEDPAQAPAEVYAAGSDLQLTQLQLAGTRFIAAGRDGWVSFDRDGSNADAMPSGLGDRFHAIGHEPADAVGFVTSSMTYVGYQRLGAGDPLTGPRSLSMDNAAAVTVGAAGGDAISVWAFNSALYARIVAANGNVSGDAFLVQAGAYSTTTRLLAVSGDSEMSLFWYGAPNQGSFQSQLLKMDANGAIGTPNVFYSTPVQHDLVQVVAINGGFMALIFDIDGTPRFLRLDENGNVTDTSLGLAGVDQAHGLASQGDRIAVVAGRDTGEPELRVFDLDLTPQSPWVCLDMDHEPSIPAAVSPDGDGYAVIYQTKDGATKLSRVDAAGTGAP